MVLLVAGISDYFGGAVGTLFLLLFFFLLLCVSDPCSRREAAGLHGEDAGSPGRQHPQPDQSPERQLPFFAAGPLDHQRRLAGFSEVGKASLLAVDTNRCGCPSLKCLVVLLIITHTATLSEMSWGDPGMFPSQSAN